MSSSSLAALLLQGTPSDSCSSTSNPLSSLSKTIQQKHQLAEHRKPYSSSHRQQPNLLLHQELANEQQQQQQQQQQQHNNWSSAFLRTVPVQSILQQSNPRWESEFTHHLDQQKPIHPQTIIPATPLPAFTQLPRFTPHHHLSHHHPYHPLQSTHPITQEPSIQRSATAPVLDWDSAFLSYDHATTVAGPMQAQPEEQNQESAYLARSHSPINSSSPDALAQTAASLIATVESGQQAHHSIKTSDQPGLSSIDGNSTADKFTQSSFMEFMRQLRDGEVKVEGDKVVQQIAPVRGASSTIDHGTQMNSHSQTPGLSINSHPQNLKSFGISGNQPATQTTSQLDSSHQAMMNSFQGDGGGISESDDILSAELDDLLNAASEVGRPEKQTWTNTATHVPGATESWTEDFDQHQTASRTAPAVAGDEEDAEFDVMGMFGRPIHAREFELERLKRLQHVPSAQQQEWERLQTDWDTMASDLAGLSVEDPATTTTTSSTSAISPATFLERIQALRAETGYTFQQANPQLFLRSDHRSMHHSSHHQTWEESVSPLESVLQKEKEVLSEPESASAWYELGVKQQENEREEMAIQALQHAIHLDPMLSDAILALAISYSNENRRADALAEIERWIGVETGRVAKYRQAAAPRPSDQLPNDEDRAGMDEPSKLREKHAELTSRLIEIARLGGRVPDKASVDPDVQIALGVLFNANDEFEKACDCFATALAVRPLDPLLFNRLGATLANSGKPDEAVEYYNRAIELLPSYIRARYNLSISLINMGKYRESLQNLFDALVIQDQASSASSSLAFPPQATEAAHGPLHRLSGSQGERSGVTSDVLWETLGINCSLLKGQVGLSQAELESCVSRKDLDQLKQILPHFL
ncbi:hypothetical protein PTTG_03023 [Puccinia triticina 1-1 BBBD Race 1]|uniref:Peroxin-5 n=1 Tax=Puccinia triticina (isolate 1-1 / race 1 (BBBD)) TaxID=630390 RepID=A0A180GRC6_PUCT1|nr:hypothetical protein PTTG_03023 [Puccinia triticina 1-1 BBBD Race 1]